MYVISILMSKGLCHMLYNSVSSDTDNREKLGNRKLFTISLTLSDYSVKNSRFRTIPNTT